MKLIKIITLLVLFSLTVFSVRSQDYMFNGSVYCYNKSDGLKYISLDIMSKKYATNVLEEYKTYNVDNNTFEVITKSNEFSVIYLANKSIIKVCGDSEFRIDSFDVFLDKTVNYPVKVNVVSYNLNLSLMKGEFYVLVSNKTTNDQYIVQTSISNFELESGKYYIQTTDNSVLIYILDGTLGVYDNVTNKKEIVNSGNAVLVHPAPKLSPKQIELFSDKMTTNVKKVKSDQFKLQTDSINTLNYITNKIIFIQIDQKVIGVKIK